MPRTWMGGATRVLLTAILLVASTAHRGAAQISTDIIRGQVTDSAARPIAGVEIQAVSYQGQVTKKATSDRNGRFTIVFINGEGDYWITMRKLGFAQRRFEIKKIGDEEVMLADSRMISSIVSLDGVTTTAQRDRALPNRAAKDVDVGGGDKSLTNALVAPSDAGNLAAMAAAAGFQVVPGLDGAPDMYSVLGLSGDQNNLTFNGLGSGISALPPDVLATTSINAYPFDVSKGGFSGAQITVQTLPGSNFSRRSVTTVGLAPQLQWADASAVQQGQRYTNARIGGNAAGPIVADKAFYNAAYNVARRSNDAHTLLNTDALGLASAGVAMDSVNRFIGYLTQQGIPTTLSAVPRTQSLDLVQGLVNADIMPSASGTGHSFTVAGVGNYQRSEPVDRGGLLLATPSHSDETRVWSANATLIHMNYFGFGILSKTSAGVAAQSTTTTPFQQLPEGLVRVASSLGSGTASVKTLSFGGNAIRSASSTQALQLRNQLSWFSLDNRHTIRVTSSLAEDAFTTNLGQQLDGTFIFNSLADLQANRPSSFSRTLGSSAQTGRQLVGGVSLGDYWRPIPEIQVQYGARVDANRLLTHPAYNGEVERQLGLRNDAVPSDVYVSPRIGLQWAYGHASQISYAPGSARPPLAVVHAGVGLFQNTAPATFIAPARNATGLPSSTRTISCVGGAVPFPRWGEFLADPSVIPSTCADGSAANTYGTNAPRVVLFDPGFRQPRSLRAAADWSGPVLDNRFVLGVQGIVSTGSDEQGFIDVNLSRTPSFVLANEGGRPIYAKGSDIVPSTGSIAAGSGRVSSQFQSVLMQRSDLGARARQLTINLKPVTARAKLRWELTYTLLDARNESFGFANTAGDPFDKSWSRPAQTPRHTVSLAWRDFPVFDLVYVSALVSAASGLPYTPMIATDVNGDGLGNDRAFIADPNKATDGALASGMRALLTHGSPSARDCLSTQLDRLAANASCSGPWTMTNLLQIKLNPTKVGLPKRATLSVAVFNPLGIADLALHGNDARGWGQRVVPDQNLLFVRGFDPVSQRFSYEVNQRFGSTRLSETTSRNLPYMSVSLSIDLGVPRERQLLTQRLDAGRGKPGAMATAQSMKEFGTSAIPNPMAMILTQQLELGLTRPQADSLANLSHSFSAFADSVWTPVAAYLATLPTSYHNGDAYARYRSARERTVDYLLTMVSAADGVLTPSQRRRLPLQVSNYLDRRVLEFLRSSTLGVPGSPGG